MNRMTLRRRAALVLAPVVTLGAVLLAGPASAHVTVSSTDAAQGGYGKLTFRVPNESETAATTRLVVTLPADQPFAHLTVGAKPGWTVEAVKTDLPEPVEVHGAKITQAVTTVTWTATGDGIAVGQFDEFAISGGPFPDADTISFSAEQTYADGEVVDWADVASGDEEPAHPAPTLTLAAATEGGHGTAADAEPVAATSDDDGSSDDLARVVAGVAVLVAVGSLGVALRQNRRRA